MGFLKDKGMSIIQFNSYNYLFPNELWKCSGSLKEMEICFLILCLTCFYDVFSFFFLQGSDVGTMKSATTINHLSVSEITDDVRSLENVQCLSETVVDQC